MSRGITDGIVLAHRYGFLTSTSLMPNMPASEYAIERVRAIPSLGVGVHLNICAGKPVSVPHDVSTLIGTDGHFHPPSRMIRRLWSGRVSPLQIKTEFRAQIQWMTERGIVPTHADSHHHMHIYPAAIRAFVRALNAEGIECARTPRSSMWPPSSAVGGPYEGSLLRRLTVTTYRATLHHFAFRSLSMPESRISFSSRDRHNPEQIGDQWKLAFANLPPGTFELGCHPGLFERSFSESDRLRHQREHELRWLTSAEWREAIERRGIRLISYRDLSCKASAQSAIAQVHAVS